MVLFDYRIDKSKINGLGVFTNEKIKKGFVVFKASLILDLELSKEQFDSLSYQEQKEFIHYGYLDKKSNTYKLNFDTALRFLNYDKNGNIYQDENHCETYLIAKRDIEANEEITFDYLEVMNEEWFNLEFNDNNKYY